MIRVNNHLDDEKALRLACENGHLEVEKGVNIYVDYDHVFHQVCENDHLKVAKFLVDNGADIYAGCKIYRFLIKHGIIKN